MQNITTRELKHLCNFLTHTMNYKVELVSDEDFEYDGDWIFHTQISETISYVNQVLQKLSAIINVQVHNVCSEENENHIGLGNPKPKQSP